MSPRSGEGRGKAVVGRGNGQSATAPVTRDDIEAKFRELQGDVEQGVEAARGIGVVVGVTAAVAAVVLAYWFGRRRGRRRQMVVEVRRL